MANLITESFTLPAHWASYLVNGDASGLEDYEQTEIDDFLASHRFLGECLGCSEEPELTMYDDLLTSCLDYTFPVQMTQVRGELEYLIYSAHRFDEPMAHHKAGLSWTATGYGKKIPTTKVMYLPDGRQTRRYRVYCHIFSNAGTCYIMYQGRKVVVE